MKDETNYGLVAGVLILCVATCTAGLFGGFYYGVSTTIVADQRAATLAGAAKWVVNKETGAPEFAWVQCTALGVTK